jgi:hypothetical protein
VKPGSALDRPARRGADAPRSDGRGGCAADRARAAPGLRSGTPIRSILPGEHDVLAVFTTAADEHATGSSGVIWNRKLEQDPKPR